MTSELKEEDLNSLHLYAGWLNDHRRNQVRSLVEEVRRLRATVALLLEVGDDRPTAEWKDGVPIEEM